MTRRSSLLFALPLLLLSCRRVPAELPDMDPEPARTEKVFVEQQPERREAPPGTFMPVSTDVASLYSCWFRNPYSYMFHGGTDALEVNGGYYGMFMAGVHGILYYGNLNNCAGELIGQPPGWYSDIAPIEAFAGVPASLPSTTYSFATVNPEFIAYARRQLLPPPDQAIDGIPVQLAYDRVFRRFFRLMTVSLMTVLETTDIARETDDYLAATSAGQDGITWLEGRYNGRIAGFPEGWDGTTLTAPMAAGFWLRRHADKSFAASWHGLREVLDRYDPAWLAEQKAQYPKAAAALEQLPDPMVTQP